MRNTAYSTETFEHKGYTFTMSLYFDPDMGAPWDEHDGHGIVSEWTTRDKRSGEWILASDHSSHRFYDFAETLKIARKDGWGLGPDEIAKLKTKLGRKPTKKEITAESVRRDFEYLRRWCNDQWHWCGVAVTSEELGETDPYSHAVWGVESEDTNGYHMQLATEYAEEIIDEWRERQAEVLA